MTRAVCSLGDIEAAPLPLPSSLRVDTMKFINMYLVGYVVLIIGVVLALWKMNVLQHISGVWIAIGVVLAIGLGVMMSVAAGKPAVTRE